MQHFKTLRTQTWFALSLILGFALVTLSLLVSSCATSKNQVSNVVIGLKAEAVPEGISITFDNIPKNAQYLSVSLYDITADDKLYTGTNFHDNDLEQIRKANILVCPFVKNGHKYEITVTAYIETEKNVKLINSGTTTAIANGGIHIINNPILIWNNSNNITTLSAKPLFSDEKINSQNIELNYGLVFSGEKSGGKVSGGVTELTNELTYDNTQNFNSIVEMIGNTGLSGDIPIFADVQLSLEYKNIKWSITFAKTEDIIYSL